MKSSATRRMARPVARIRGGKFRMAPWILGFFPPHTCYVEPYCGGASLLFQKEPAQLECINDLDGDVVTFFRVLRERPEELVRVLRLTPYAREELRLCHQPAPADISDLERARRFFTRCALGRGNSSRPSGFRTQYKTYGWGKNVTREFANIDHLFEGAARIKEKVQIENLDALELIPRFDAPETLFYIDPPYLAENRSGKLYQHEMMDEAGHRALAKLLRGLQGMVLLSSGLGDLYPELYGGWDLHTKMARGEQHKEYTECLWINPAARDALRKAVADTLAAQPQGMLKL